MSSDTITTLTFLQNYADASEKAHEDLKSCIWQLTKSRRNNQSGIIGIDSTTAYTAELLREQLRAQFCVIGGDDEGDIQLLNEDSIHTKNRDEGDLCTVTPEWKLYDLRSDIGKSTRSTKVVNKIGMKNKQIIEKKTLEETPVTSLDTSPSSSWTIIQEDDVNRDVEDDDSILRIDPIKLFGGYFTSRELKAAQRNAQQSLMGYIQAANEAAKLLEFLRQNNDS